MRFTRPGARPRQAPSMELDATQLGRGVLGARIKDERAGAELRSGEVFQFVPASVRRVELDVEVVMAAAAAARFLVHRHHIGQRPLEKAVVLLQQALEVVGKRLIVLLVEVRQPPSMIDRREMHLVRPAREGRDECNPTIVGKDDPLGAALALDDVAVKASAGLAHVPRLGTQLTLDDWRHEWIRVDLSVRMAERDADNLASILEDVDVADVGQPAELIGAVAPDVDEVSDMIDALLAER